MRMKTKRENILLLYSQWKFGWNLQRNSLQSLQTENDFCIFIIETNFFLNFTISWRDKCPFFFSHSDATCYSWLGFTPCIQRIINESKKVSIGETMHQDRANEEHNFSGTNFNPTFSFFLPAASVDGTLELRWGNALMLRNCSCDINYFKGSTHSPTWLISLQRERGQISATNATGDGL